VAVGEPVATGLVASLARPGGNITGLTSTSEELEGKRLELLRQVIPKLSHVAVLWNPENSPHGRADHRWSALIAKTGGLILTLVLLAAAPGAAAQEAKVYRIGYLSSANPRSAAFFQAFEQRLRELGYIEGRNLAIEFRNAEGRLDRLPGLAAELVRLNVNVIVTATDHATRAAKEATATIPILIVGVNFDPVALKFVTSVTRPGTNVTGLFFLHLDL